MLRHWSRFKVIGVCNNFSCACALIDVPQITASMSLDFLPLVQIDTVLPT